MMARQEAAMRHPALVLTFLSFVTVSSLMISCLAARAQDATPARESVTVPMTPDPAMCQVQPLTVDELLERMGAAPLPATPGSMGAGGTPPPAPPFTLPAGEPADAETVADLTATMVGTLACQSTGNWLAVFTFYTDDFLRRLRDDVIITEQDIAGWREATPEPMAPEEYTMFLGVREARVLPDGRVGALVDADFKAEEGLETDFVYFARHDGRWLIDEVVFALEEQYPPATPTP
jgi:hypothetical protein